MKSRNFLKRNGFTRVAAVFMAVLIFVSSLGNGWYFSAGAAAESGGDFIEGSEMEFSSEPVEQAADGNAETEKQAEGLNAEVEKQAQEAGKAAEEQVSDAGTEVEEQAPDASKAAEEQDSDAGAEVEEQAPEASTIYGVVSLNDISSREVEASMDDIRAVITFEKDAGLPEGTTAVISPVEDETPYQNEAEAVLESRNKRLVKMQLFDLSLRDPEGNEVQPKAPVTVKISLKKAPKQDVQLIHFTDERKEESKSEDGAIDEERIIDPDSADEETETEDGDTRNGEQKDNVSTDEESVKDGKETNSETEDSNGDTTEGSTFTVLRSGLKSAQKGGSSLRSNFKGNTNVTTEDRSDFGLNSVFSTKSSEKSVESDNGFVAELLNSSVEGTEITFVTDGFSVYGLAYTVDFHYGEYEYHLQGNGEMLLSELFALLNIDCNVADVISVEFSDPNLLQIEQIEGDWKLTSLAPFLSIETLTVKFLNGDTIVIRVEDAQYDYIAFVSDEDAGYFTSGTNNLFQTYSNNDAYQHVSDVEYNDIGIVYFKHNTTGKVYSITANAITGYQFDYWLKVDPSGSTTIIDKSTIIYSDMGTLDGATFIAFYVPNGQKLIRYVADEHGTISDANHCVTDQQGRKHYFSYSGEDMYAHATADWGYILEGWYNGTVLLSTDEYLNLSDVTSDMVITAKFRSREKYEIKYHSTWYYTNIRINDGPISYAKDADGAWVSEYVTDGETAKGAVASSHGNPNNAGEYSYFIAWIDSDGNHVSSNANFVPTGDQIKNTTYTAVFSSSPNYVVIDCDYHGGTVGGTSGLYSGSLDLESANKATNIVFAKYNNIGRLLGDMWPIPNEGYVFDHWEWTPSGGNTVTITDERINSNNSTIQGKGTLKVVFKPHITYDIGVINRVGINSSDSQRWYTNVSVKNATPTADVNVYTEIVNSGDNLDLNHKLSSETRVTQTTTGYNLLTHYIKGWTADRSVTVRLSNGTQTTISQGNLIPPDATILNITEALKLTAVWSSTFPGKKEYNGGKETGARYNTNSVGFFVRIVDNVANVGNTSLYTDCLYTSRLLLSGSGSFAADNNTTGTRHDFFGNGRTLNMSTIEDIDRDLRNNSSHLSYSGTGYSNEQTYDSRYENAIINVESFPDNNLIFDQIRRWNASRHTITVSGQVVPQWMLTSDYFDIRWYVLKDQENQWHIDGMLIPKYAKLRITKKFIGEANAITAAKEGYSISAQHGSDAAFTRTLEQANHVSEDGTEYTWILDKLVPLTSYTVKEQNYNATGYAVATSYQLYNTKQTNGLSGNTDTVIVNEVYVYPDYETEESYQTVAFTNMYTEPFMMTIMKQDGDTKNALPGAVFDVTIKNELNEIVKTDVLTSDPEGKMAVNFQTLGAGNYTFELKERSRQGYQALDPTTGLTTITGNVSVTEQGLVTLSNVNATVTGDNVVPHVDVHNPSIVFVENKPERVDVSVKKQWKDIQGNNQQNGRPVTIQLLRNGIPMTGKMVVLGSSVTNPTDWIERTSSWEYTWADLPAYVDGDAAYYSVREEWIGEPGAEGSIQFSSSIEDGFENYIVVQTQIITESGSRTIYSVHIENIPDEGQIIFTKTELNHKALSGAVFGVYNSRGWGMEFDGTESKIKDVTSDANGVVRVTGLANGGWYWLKEETAPDGYVKKKDLYLLEIKNNNSVMHPYKIDGQVVDNYIGKQTSTITNPPYKANITLIKTGQNDVRLQDAVFTLYDEDTAHVIGGCESVHTNANGEITFNDLLAGTYNLVEVTPPSGYIALSDPITIIVNANTGVTTTSAGVTLENTSANNYTITVPNSPETTSITVQKNWADGNNHHTGDSITMNLVRYKKAASDSSKANSTTYSGTTTDPGTTDDTTPETGTDSLTGMETPTEPNEMDLQTISRNSSLRPYNIIRFSASNGVSDVEVGSGLPSGYVEDSGFTATSITLSISNNWNDSFTELLMYDENGEVYYYQVVEQVPTGYDVTYSRTYMAADSTVPITLTVENSPKPGNLSVKKIIDGGSITSFNFRVTLGDNTINGTYGEMTFTDGVSEFILGNNETKTATGLPAWTSYTVEETDANLYDYATTVTFGNTNGTIPVNDTASVEFTNTYTPSTGSLKLKKIVTVGGQTPNNDNSNLVNGAYDFSIKKGDDVVKYVRIVMWLGKMAYYQIHVDRNKLSDVHWCDTQYDEDPEWNSWIKAKNGLDSVLISDLEAGEYVITELGSKCVNYNPVRDWRGDPYEAFEVGEALDNVHLISITGGKNDANLTARTITVTVTGGDNAASNAEAQAVFTNNINAGTLSLRKVAAPSFDAPVSGAQDKVAGTYKFTLVGPVDANNQPTAGAITKYIRIYADTSGQYSYEVKETDSGWDRTKAISLEENKGVVLDHLKTGDYLINETGWELDTQTSGAEIYLESISASNSSAYTFNTDDRVLKVHVDGADITEVEAVFRNELVPNTMTHRKMVLDINDSLEADPFNSDREHTWADSADYDIDDLIPYRVTGYLPQGTYKAADSYYYRVDDVMQNLAYENGTGHMFVFVKGPTETVGKWYQVDEYFTVSTPASMADTSGTITSDGNDTMKYLSIATNSDAGLKAIVRGYLTTWGAADTHANDQEAESTVADASTPIDPNHIQYLQFRYKAKLLSSANIGTSGNANDARIVYGNGTQSTDWDRNRVFTYKLVVNKKDENGNDLTGATFQLFKKYITAPSGASSQSISNGGYNFYGGDTTKLGAINTNIFGSNLSTGNYYLVNGKVNGSVYEWNGIDDGNYILVETSAPEHYAAMSVPIGISINAAHEMNAADPALITNSTYVNIFPDSGVPNVSNFFVSDGSCFNSGFISANIPNEPLVDITANKVWANAENTVKPAAIQFTLYRSTNQETYNNSSSADRFTDGTRYYIKVTDPGVSNPTVLLPTVNGSSVTWNETVSWNGLPKYSDYLSNGDKGEYTYLVRETGVYFGSLSQDDLNTEDIDESRVISADQWITSETAVKIEDLYTVTGGTVTDGQASITNTPNTVDVPVEKTWQIDNENDDTTWTATFQMEEKEEYLFGARTADSISVFTLVSPAKVITVSKGDSGEGVTFKGLPRYRVYDNGGVYRVLYSAKEIAYEVKQNGETINKWDETNGLTVGEKQYNATLIHAAGDSNDSNGLSEGNDKLYTIQLNNRIDSFTESRSITVSLSKIWENNAANGVEDAYANFKLRRYYQEGYREFSTSDYDPNQTYTVTVGSSSLQVFKGAKVSIAATFKTAANGGKGNLIIRDGEGNQIYSYNNTEEGNVNHVERFGPIVVTGDISYTNIDGNGLLESLVVTDMIPNSEWTPDAGWSRDIRLSDSNSWSSGNITLGTMALGDYDSSTGRQTERLYSYYFEETASNPSNFCAEYTSTNSSVTINLGDISNRISDNAQITATNKEKKPFRVSKEWLALLGSDLQYYPEVSFTLYRIPEWKDYVDASDVYRPGGPNDNSFVNIKLNYGNNWTWDCPVQLPETYVDNGQTRYWRYYVIETPKDANKTVDEVVWTYPAYDKLEASQGQDNNNLQITVEGYRSRNSLNGTWYDGYGNGRAYQTSGGDLIETYAHAMADRPQDASIGNTGEIQILNKAIKYIQMDLKKKFLRVISNATDNGWDLETRTHEEAMLHDLVIELQLKRRIVQYDSFPALENMYPVGNDSDPYVVIKDWEDYGAPVLIGYRNNHEDPVYYNPSTNPYRIRNGNGDWHWVIDNEYQDKGIPGYGFYPDPENQNNIIPVRYQYIFVEINAYDNLQKQNPRYWFNVLPAAWDGAKFEVELFPKVVAQDQDRLVNVLNTSIQLQKEWTDGKEGADAVYVKVWRKAGEGGTFTDYTNGLKTSFSDLWANWNNRDGGHDGLVNPSNLKTVTVNGMTENYIVIPRDQTVSIDYVLNFDSYHYYTGYSDAIYYYKVEECGYRLGEQDYWDVSSFSPRYEFAQNAIRIPANGETIALDTVNENNNLFKIVNTVSDGNLVINKKIAAGSTAAAGDVFTFDVVLRKADGSAYTETVKVTDSTRSTAANVKPDSSGKVTVTVQGAGTAMIEGIKQGTTYTVTEQAITGWQQTGVVYSNTNDVKAITAGAADSVTVTNKQITEIHAAKVWVDNNNSEGLRPASIIFTLNAAAGGRALTDTEMASEGITTGTQHASVTIAPNASGEWPQVDWVGLPVHTQNGDAITYSVMESSVEYYTATYANVGNNWTITNTLNKVSIDIVKVKDGTTEQLSGAVFQLQRWNGTDYVNYRDPITVNGSATISDLPDGQYKLIETQAPAGYIRLEGEVTFTVSAGTVTNTSAGGNTIRYDAANSSTSSNARFTIGNTPGVELPATGGPGTVIYTAAGLMMVLLAGALMISRKRRRIR